MKKVYMTTFGDEGNCLAACVCTLLELDIEDFPVLSDNDWLWDVNDFLRHHRHILITLDWDTFWDKRVTPGLKGKYIVSGMTERTDKYPHAVIYEDDQLWHDPFPGASGILAIDNILCLVRMF